jgi:cytochrome c biogenesis protein CcdA
MAARVPREKRWQLHLCFVGGLALSYALLAGSIALLARMTAASPIAYAMLAALLLWFGVRSVVRNPDTCEDHGHQSAITSGSAFLTGAGYAFVVSPCCTPVVAAIAGAAGTLTSPEFAAAVAVMFGLGHASAVLLGSLAVSRLWRTSFAIARRPEFSIVSGAVMIALGGYYALLA